MAELLRCMEHDTLNTRTWQHQLCNDKYITLSTHVIHANTSLILGHTTTASLNYSSPDTNNNEKNARCRYIDCQTFPLFYCGCL